MVRRISLHFFCNHIAHRVPVTHGDERLEFLAVLLAFDGQEIFQRLGLRLRLLEQG
jgi:hypothetical protein